ncbi:MAG: N-6 DNA methylase [Planctomycetes bacterium]|nr:N-6 DNA methylase [Planctomycetota bacterium]
MFFRRFSGERSSQVAAYVIDNSDGKLDDKTLSELHRQVWLQGTTPLLYIDGASQIDILACAREPDFWDNNKQECKYNPAKTLKKDLLTTAGQISDEMKKFSALKLADGTFWDDPDNRKLANHDKAAHQSLIQAIVDADKDIDGENNPVQRRLLLLVVLIKYLEDRKVFPKAWFSGFQKGAKKFLDVLKDGDPKEVYRLLKNLECKFNGEVFDLSRLGKQKLTKKALRTFAKFVEARTLKNQLYLWDQYSFEHLPVEIISHLYQRFIKDGHGAVYTPPFLAALLLDHTMPYNKMTGKERILDPACGSGVFLVGAFKRLINLWRSKNNWENPTVEKLKETLGKCIYGVDLDKNAVDLTAFSLSLAICDALRPNVIWNKLRFDYLRESNLFESDFFDLLLDSQNGNQNILDTKFDIVIGNPPFESELTESGEKVDQVAHQQDSSRGSLPDKQTAYLFLEQALTVLKPKSGRICMIQPHGLLYNNGTEVFRTSTFQKCKLNTILDFISIRKLYDAADPKTIAVFACAGKPTANHFINHWTFRRTVSVKERICFELDHYDCHRISQRQAETDPYVWRANLLGGGRLVEMSQRIRSMRTLAKYLENKKDWDYGEGFIAAKTGKREPAPFLTGKPLLPTKAFTESGIDENQISTVTDTHFRSAYTEDRYSAPIILIKELDSLPIAFREEGFLAYRDKIVGIHALQAPVAELRRLYEILHVNHNTYRFCCTLNGSQSLVSKATAILKQDIDLLPYPKDHKDLQFSFWERALCEDVLDYIADYVRLGQNSELLCKKADSSNLKEYSRIFCRMLGSIYDNLKASTPISWNNLICQPFYFGDSPELTWLDSSAEANLEKLIYDESHECLRTVRVVRLYDKNVLLIIKPNRLRYWIRSTAIRDADDTLTELYDQGY